MPDRPRPGTAYSIVVALLTPFTARGSIDKAALRDHVEWLIAQGVDGLMPCGTTGEGPLLDDNEMQRVIAQTVQAAGGRVSVFAHVGRPSTKATLKMAGSARAAGGSAISAVTPYYYELSEEQLRAHFRAVIRAVPGSPVFAYTIPERAGNDLPPDLVGSLAAEGLAGIKDSSRSLARHREYLALNHRIPGGTGSFSIFMGSAALVLDSIHCGSAGAVSALANVAPHLLVDMRRAVIEGRAQDAKAAQEELSQLGQEVTLEGGIRGLKQRVSELLARSGVRYPPNPRAPL